MLITAAVWVAAIAAAIGVAAVIFGMSTSHLSSTTNTAAVATPGVESPATLTAAVPAAQPAASSRTTTAAAPAPPAAVPAPAPTAQSTAKPAAPAPVDAGLGVVVIDAGHQGKEDMRLEPIGPRSSQKKPRVESGTSGPYAPHEESEVNLEVALKLEKALQARGVKVIMVRTSQNVDIPNSQRAKIANDAHAALFIRLHCDGVNDSSTHGFLMLRPGPNKWTGPIVASSKVAASYVDRAALAATGAYNRGTQARTDLSGFNWSKVPTILAEMGVMSNRAEDLKLVTPSYQQKLADGMANGIVAYLRSK